MQKVSVSLGPRSYEILIDRGIFPQIVTHLSTFDFDRKIAVVTHPKIGGLFGEALVKRLKGAGWRPVLLTIPPGERYKTLRTVNRIYDRLIEERFERNSPLIALGGGVIGDMTGFAAATYLRGVPYIQIPTTLLAQVDSSVGGKTGVDHPMGKNLIGAFHQPRLVWIDVDHLKTLPMRELRAGLAEVVKYGVIADASFFSFLEENVSAMLALDPDVLIPAIVRSCRIKADVVSRDEREGGLRAILNFGHTFAHGIETLTGYRIYRHGEAVAIGMVCAARLSHRMGLCPPDVAERVQSLLSRMGLPTRFPSLPFTSFVDVLQRDKKVLRGEMRFVLPQRIGDVRLLGLREKRLLKEVLQQC